MTIRRETLLGDWSRTHRFSPEAAIDAARAAERRRAVSKLNRQVPTRVWRAPDVLTLPQPQPEAVPNPDVETAEGRAADERAREKLAPKPAVQSTVPPTVLPGPAPDTDAPASAEEIEVVVRALLRGPVPAKVNSGAEACGSDTRPV